MKCLVYKLVFPKMEFIGVGMEMIIMWRKHSRISCYGFALQSCFDVYLIEGHANNN
jgi:hypothetical protein